MIGFDTCSALIQMTFVRVVNSRSVAAVVSAADKESFCWMPLGCNESVFTDEDVAFFLLFFFFFLFRFLGGVEGDPSSVLSVAGDRDCESLSAALWQGCWAAITSTASPSPAVVASTLVCSTTERFRFRLLFFLAMVKKKETRR